MASPSAAWVYVVVTAYRMDIVGEHDGSIHGADDGRHDRVQPWTATEFG